MKHARLLGLLLALPMLASCIPTTEQPQETERFTVEDGEVVLYVLGPLLEGDGFVTGGPKLRLEPASPFCANRCERNPDGTIDLTIPTGYGKPELRVPILTGRVTGGSFLVTVEGRDTVDFTFEQ